MQNRNWKKHVRDYLLTIAGCLFLALGLNLFLNPIKLSLGGISAIGTVLFHMFHIPLSATVLAFNLVLFLFAYRYLSKDSVLKTLAGIFLLSLFLQLTGYLPAYTEDIWMAAIAGGVLVGFGMGLVLRREGSTGGSDLAALILNRIFPHISIPSFILIIDCAIIALAGFLFGSITITLYSVVSLFLSTKVTDAVITMGNAAKFLYVLSPKSEEIAKGIIETLERGVTGIQSKGMYSDTRSLMLLCVVSPKELPSLVRMIRSIDKGAFVIVSDAREVVGEGFKEHSPYDSVA